MFDFWLIASDGKNRFELICQAESIRIEHGYFWFGGRECNIILPM